MSIKQITGRLFQEDQPSFKAIYHGIWNDLIKAHAGLLRPKPREARRDASISDYQSANALLKRKNVKHSIIKNSILSDKRKRLSRRSSSERVVSTIKLSMSNRSFDLMEEAIHILHASFPAGTLQTATTDRGKEFSCHLRNVRSIHVLH